MPMMLGANSPGSYWICILSFLTSESSRKMKAMVVASSDAARCVGFLGGPGQYRCWNVENRHRQCFYIKVDTASVALRLVIMPSSVEAVPVAYPLPRSIASLLPFDPSGCAFILSSSSDEFREELLLRPLPSGHLHAHFQFVTTWHVPVHNDKV